MLGEKVQKVFKFSERTSDCHDRSSPRKTFPIYILGLLSLPHREVVQPEVELDSRFLRPFLLGRASGVYGADQVSIRGLRLVQGTVNQCSLIEGPVGFGVSFNRAI